ncbi:MAG: hypothetical protein A2078_14465 [Nitrospirae bacterium GWC2_57_9]|nr:MAG: hypothetical protein A2078_14465 [Nitrospirae bacterium GWC2_57_9]
MMLNERKQAQEVPVNMQKPANYSLCRSSCSVCPYRQGLLKLLDHAVKIVPSLPEGAGKSSAE